MDIQRTPLCTSETVSIVSLSQNIAYIPEWFSMSTGLQVY